MEAPVEPFIIERVAAPLLGCFFWDVYRANERLVDRLIR